MKVTDMKGTGARDGVPKALLARALYDNHPDCSDELAFSRGDILTVLEQNVPGSEGWWKCLLHGRPGLAPANRLRVLPEGPPLPRGPETPPAAPQAAPPGPVYEPMRSWVEAAPPACQVYVLPDPPGARIICEKTLSLPRQTICVLPRPARTSLPTLPSQLYDVPTQSRGPSAPKELETQPLYDIPASPRKATLHPPPSQARVLHGPLTATITVRREGHDTLPSPQKSEWVYDLPAPLGNASRAGCAAAAGPDAAPAALPALQRPPSGRAKAWPSDSGSEEEKPRLPEAPLAPPEGPAPGSAGRRVPSSFVAPRGEGRNARPDACGVPAAKAGEALGSPAAGPSCFPACACAPDRLSVSSNDSRASVLSSCSSLSSDSTSGDSAPERALDLDVAKETAMALQHRVVSSAAALLLFVSRTWRLRDALAANIQGIRRAAGHVEGSLREFLDFARGVAGTACSLPDGHLKVRIRDQLQTVSSSYHTLLDAKESLDGCGWSLEVLAVDRVPGSLDALERFVTVARMVPEDVKRFASMVMANGKLLFKQNCEKEEATPSSPEAEIKREQCTPLPQRETPLNKQRESERSQEPRKEISTDVCGREFPNREEKKKSILEKGVDGSQDWATMLPGSVQPPPAGVQLPGSVQPPPAGVQGPGSVQPPPAGVQGPGAGVRLSEHCRLYFGALFKAIGMFTGSLGTSQPPEAFVAQSKLVITVGQKLVDTLCRETRDERAHSEVLRRSSHLCGLLRDLALATKSALQQPCPAALGRLRAEAGRLEHHARQLRGALE